MPFKIIRNDIIKMNTDAIVNTANPSVHVGAGVDTAIYKAAGMRKLLKERKQIGDIAVGDAAVTSGGRLPCKYIFHACGPRYINGRQGEPESLRRCYEKSLALALSHNCESIAFPLLSTGNYGYPREEALRIALDVFSAFLLAHEMDIYLVVFDNETVKVSKKLFADVTDYLDEHYIADTLEKEYFCPAPARTSSKSILTRLGSPADRAGIPSNHDTGLLPSDSDLGDYISQSAGSFASYLQQLINKKDLTNAEVYKKANLSKQYFSKLIHGQVNPTKEKLLCIAVALKLNLDETTDFLKFGGYALSPYNKTDLVFEYFIRHNNFDIFSIDIALFDLGLPSLMD